MVNVDIFVLDWTSGFDRLLAQGVLGLPSAQGPAGAALDSLKKRPPKNFDVSRNPKAARKTGPILKKTQAKSL